MSGVTTKASYPLAGQLLLAFTYCVIAPTIIAFVVFQWFVIFHGSIGVFILIVLAGLLAFVVSAVVLVTRHLRRGQHINGVRHD
jgi:hypothetical protein